MILPWNRHEIYVGNSMQEFSRILDILSMEKTKYDFKKIKGLLSDPGSVNISKNDMYYIYVHKKDLEKIRFLIKK